VNDPIEILEEKNLRKTSSRNDILKIFLDNSHIGLAEIDLEQEIGKTYDRATIYRTLKTFLDNGIIHKVIDEGSIVKYAICSDTCSSHEHNHEHLHFKCSECSTTTCLDENLSNIQITLPKGYIKKEANYLIIGLCPKCS